MGYSLQHANLERTEAIHQALNKEDSDQLLTIADQVKKEDEDELAEYLVQQARRIRKDEWAYDESIGN